MPNMVNDDDKNKNSDSILLSEFIRFTNAVSYVRGWISFTVISTTDKSMLPPKDITKFKKELIEEFKGRYGEDVFKDFSRLVEFEDRLKEYDREWLKDDPTYGIMSSGKIMNISRKKQFLTIGAEQGFGAPNEAQTVENSLDEEWPRDKKDLSALFNSFRAGSYGRGNETQIAGVKAKALSRATVNFKVNVDDCKVSYGSMFYITKELAKHINGRYIIENGKSTRIDKPEQYIGKTIEIRSPMYCKADKDRLCIKCVGEVVGRHENSINLMSQTLGGDFLNSFMKKMHGKELQTIEITVDNLID